MATSFPRPARSVTIALVCALSGGTARADYALNLTEGVTSISREAYRLLHLAAGYRGDRVEATAWLRNALDEDYVVHGFYFGNDPRTFYVNEAWYQYGAPRVAGVTVSWSLE